MRYLNLVSTSMSRPESLDQDPRFIEIYQDLPKVSIISWSRSRNCLHFHKSRSRLLLLIHFPKRHLWKVIDPQKPISKISQKMLINLNNLEKSWQSWFISTILIKILTQPSLDWKVSILKISTEKKKLISTQWTFWTFFKSWSQQIEKSWSRLVLDCRDPQAYKFPVFVAHL